MTSFCVSKVYGTSVATSRFSYPEVVASHYDWFVNNETAKSLGETRDCTCLRISFYVHKEFPDIVQTEEHWVDPSEPTKVIKSHLHFVTQPCVDIVGETITKNIK